MIALAPEGRITAVPIPASRSCGRQHRRLAVQLNVFRADAAQLTQQSTGNSRPRRGGRLDLFLLFTAGETFRRLDGIQRSE